MLFFSKPLICYICMLINDTLYTKLYYWVHRKTLNQEETFIMILIIHAFFLVSILVWIFILDFSSVRSWAVVKLQSSIFMRIPYETAIGILSTLCWSALPGTGFLRVGIFLVTTITRHLLSGGLREEDNTFCRNLGCVKDL